jgi:hypothetical protein
MIRVLPIRAIAIVGLAATSAAAPQWPVLHPARAGAAVMAYEHAHDTAVPWRGLTQAPLPKPRAVLDPAEPVVVRAVDPGTGSASEVLHALHEQHRLYWERLIPEYSRYIGDDLLRIAERGVRTKGELIGGIDDKLFRPMSPQLDERVHLAGNAAIVLWRDGGVSDEGVPTQSWVTMIFAKRGGQWQIVQMHSTAIPPSRALPVPH